MSKLDSSDPRRKAVEKGLTFVEPKADELFVDLDSVVDRRVLWEGLLVLQENGFPVTVQRETVSPGGNAHVYLKLSRRLERLERMLLQACLGSDRKRELLAFIEVCKGKNDPTCFFEKTKEVVEEVPF